MIPSRDTRATPGSLEIHSTSGVGSASPRESLGVAISRCVAPTASVATPGTTSTDAMSDLAAAPLDDGWSAGASGPAVTEVFPAELKNNPAAAAAPIKGMATSHVRLRRLPATWAGGAPAIGDVSGVICAEADAMGGVTAPARDLPALDGMGVRGVWNWASKLWLLARFTIVIICVRTALSFTDRMAAMASTAASTEGHRFSGFFSSMRMTASARSGGHSGHTLEMGGGGSCVWRYITVMADSPSNGSLPESISYATTPREYWSAAPVMSRPEHCSGLM